MSNGETGPNVKGTLQELFGRLLPLEKGYERVDAELQGLRHELAEVKDMIRGLAGRMNQGTDWTMLATWAGLILVIGKMAADPMDARIRALEGERAERAAIQITLARLEEQLRTK
jgi:hypothetical protein